MGIVVVVMRTGSLGAAMVGLCAAAPVAYGGACCGICAT
jgi:hypothetical protein